MIAFNVETYRYKARISFEYLRNVLTESGKASMLWKGAGLYRSERHYSYNAYAFIIIPWIWFSIHVSFERDGLMDLLDIREHSDGDTRRI